MNESRCAFESDLVILGADPPQLDCCDLHYAALTATAEPETDKFNDPLVSRTGFGPEVHLDLFGTGFLALEGGQVLTNHHVAEPWWHKRRTEGDARSGPRAGDG